MTAEIVLGLAVVALALYARKLHKRVNALEGGTTVVIGGGVPEWRVHQLIRDAMQIKKGG